MSNVSVYNSKTGIALHPKVDIKTNDLKDFSIENEKIIASFNRNGSLKSVTLKSSGKQYPISLKFVK